jgi:hypothetical protein
MCLWGVSQVDHFLPYSIVSSFPPGPGSPSFIPEDHTEYRDDPTECKHLWWGCHRTRPGAFGGISCREEAWNLGSTAVPGGRWGTKAHAAQLPLCQACVIIIINSCWITRPGHSRASWYPTSVAAFLAHPRPGSEWLQIPSACFHRVFWVSFLNCSICAESVVPTRL